MVRQCDSTSPPDFFLSTTGNARFSNFILVTSLDQNVLLRQQSATFCWALRQVDFVMAYPQAPIEMDICMELPQGIQTAHGNSKDHVLKLEKNIYGQKQAGCVWNSFLVDKLMSLGCFRSGLAIRCLASPRRTMNSPAGQCSAHFVLAACRLGRPAHTSSTVLMQAGWTRS